MSEFPYTVCFYCADQNTHRDRSRGITHYTYGLLSHLRDVNAVGLLAVVSMSSFEIPDGIQKITLPFQTDHLPGRLLADHLHSFLTPRNAAPIWHYPKGFLPMGRQVKAKKVGTIPDVMLQFYADHHPGSRSRLAFAYWLRVLKDSIRKLDLIITVSEFSKRGILEFCERHHQKCPPIIVTYEGVDVAPCMRSTPEKQDYVVHLASHLPHKATGWLLEQWSSLGRTTRDLPMLKLVGDLDARSSASLARLKNVSLVPPLPRAELLELIAAGRALLLPSEIEGFGIPAVEAYLLGTPVAYVRGTAVEEILGNESPGGFYRDIDSFRTALSEVLNLAPGVIQSKAAWLKRRYSWNDCIGRTLEAYKAAL